MALSSDQQTPFASEEDFEDFFENALCGFLTVGVDGKIRRANRRISNWLGFHPDQLRGKKFTELLSVGGMIFYETHLAPLLRMQGYFNEVALEIVSRDNQRNRMIVNGYECSEGSDKPRYIRYTVYQATERLIYEENLRQARKVAEDKLKVEKDLATLREQFVAILGHDLRSPISAIKAGTTVLADTDLPERESQIVALMQDSVERILELIANTLDFARVRMGKGIPVEVSPVAPESIIRQVIEELRLSWPNLIFDSDIDLSEKIDCDAGRLSQVLSNLLANAILHGEAGRPIRIQAGIKDEVFTLSVCNYGEAILPEVMEKLFEPFTRGDIRNSQNGLGLGLFIADRIATAHHGQLTVSSSDEETCFTLTMPSRSP